ncbi:hypothetical protein HPB51_018541 [Rhipicephalus microplus]|uniref:Uncharacterized protein n=1 Tax=Rhipicephalus microplus TaxID=6941 RepID=A0A9J6DIP2_RHIMP|nr:hypothetical protein HPB51_018541 [Rhipicephalus microplus]
MDKIVNVAGTWQRLRRLLHLESTKTASKQELERVAHKVDGTKRKVIEVRNKYTNPAGSEPFPDYGGRESSALGAAISLAEVPAETNRSRTRSVAGVDKVINNMIPYINDRSIANLATYMRECWEKGTIPQE